MAKIMLLGGTAEAGELALAVAELLDDLTPQAVGLALAFELNGQELVQFRTLLTHRRDTPPGSSALRAPAAPFDGAAGRRFQRTLHRGVPDAIEFAVGRGGGVPGDSMWKRGTGRWVGLSCLG